MTVDNLVQELMVKEQPVEVSIIPDEYEWLNDIVVCGCFGCDQPDTIVVLDKNNAECTHCGRVYHEDDEECSYSFSASGESKDNGVYWFQDEFGLKRQS